MGLHEVRMHDAIMIPVSRKEMIIPLSFKAIYCLLYSLIQGMLCSNTGAWRHRRMGHGEPSPPPSPLNQRLHPLLPHLNPGITALPGSRKMGSSSGQQRKMQIHRPNHDEEVHTAASASRNSRTRKLKGIDVFSHLDNMSDETLIL